MLSYTPISADKLKHIRLIDLKFWALSDVAMMRLAMSKAQQGSAIGEIPVGAVIALDGRVIGMGFNQPISSRDATAHAEIVALRAACAALDNYRLPMGATLYVTLEPCTMCFGALIHARISRIVYAATEPKSGVVGSQLNLSQMSFYNHRLSVQSGLYACECGQMLSEFFRQRRQQKRALKLTKVASD